jgi:hypothetical protein
MSGAAIKSATAIINSIAATQITTSALLPNLLFEPMLQFGIIG